jgi:hypothetical protein
MTINIKLIGLIGKARSGKDTVGKYIETQYNGKCYALADPIKDLSRTLFLFDEEQLYGSKKEIIDERWGITPRQTFQMIGTNIMQFAIYGFIPDLLNKVPMRQFCIKHFKEWLNRFQTESENTDKIVIVTDIRFPHEADMIKDMNGILIKINRPSLNTSGEQYKHCSETAELSYNYLIHNDDTIEKLYQNVDEILGKYL